jgi:hypothetical protein
MQAIRRALIRLVFLLPILFLQTAIGQAAPDEPPRGRIGTQGRTYYVAPTGSDTYPGTEVWPWRTIRKAADTLVAGDTIYIKAGTYPERVAPQNSGSAGSYITYAAYPGDTVTIDGSGVTLPDDLAGLFHISNRGYIVVSGLGVTNAGPHNDNAGILILGSSNIVVESNHTYNTNSSGIGVWGSNNVTVDSNRIEEAGGGGWQECISIAGTDTFQVRNNEVLNCHKEGICAKDGSSNGQIYRNHIHDTQRVGIYVDAWDKHTHDISVFRNVVHDVSESDGFAVASETGGLLQNVYIYNNVAYHNRYIGFSVSTNGDGGPMDGIAIMNNTAYDNGWPDWGGGIAVDNPNAQNVVVRNNIVSQNLYFQVVVAPDVPAQNYTVDHNLVDGYRGTEGEVYGDDVVEGDPLFVNPSKADFHLRQGSPAIDAGSPIGAPSADFDGYPRPRDGDHDGRADYDIGAYEEGSQPAHKVYLPLVSRR